MNSKAEVIAISSDRPPYPQSKSKWFGRAKRDKFRLVFSFYSPDGCEISMPIASMSAYLKKHYPEIELLLDPVLILSDPEEYTPENFARRIAKHDADLIAFSIMSPHWPPMEAYFAALKELLPDLPILIGGYQPTLSPDETIGNSSIDYICVGDGEYAVTNVIDHLRGSKEGPADGIWEKLADGSIYVTEPHQIGDIQALPFPDYDIFKKDDGFERINSSIFGPKGVFVLPVMTGRGCPYKCTYCCNTPLLESWKSKKTYLRKYEPQAMVDELIRLKDKYSVGYFEFWDELFLSNLKFVRAFFSLYKEKVGLPFSINSRVEVMNEEFCTTAADAGCHTIWFGIESGDEDFRSKVLGRKMKNQQVIDAAANCKKAGINRLTFNIVGMPGETAASMRKTLSLNQQISPEFFFFFPFVPLRGTPLYETAKRAGLLQDLKKNIHYLSSSNDKQFTLNLKEQPELLSQQQYSELCFEMLQFQEANNRLSYTDGEFEGDASTEADVQDKSFVLTEDPPEELGTL
ncbi:MAG TPA: hypothetical protein DCM64_06330 [Gammaproteobacteria bacterium]|jgi:radical SAM superfamily enzyme YgiQ (UPF0313 family)|nr:radical SAM protein [Gammaproteobacteria bacterium]MDP6732551.1 radical SAM protein [Gammaproteobacteria bacterium]HAJ76056.1 hypothetical protein [Gammaproteobacteria bacterium]|tara:strand:+ start:758 stop:2311 length:1554 start_codon:yes stop_codon:yes gene_type:complete